MSQGSESSTPQTDTQRIVDGLLALSEAINNMVTSNNKQFTEIKDLITMKTQKDVEVKEPTKEKRVEINLNEDEISVEDGLTNIHDAFTSPPSADKKDKKYKEPEKGQMTLEAKIRAIDIADPDTPAIEDIGKTLGYHASIKDRDIVQHMIPFGYKKKLTFSFTILQLLDLRKAMISHFSTHGQRVYFRQAIHEDLQERLVTEFLGGSLEKLNDIKEEHIFSCLLVLGAPSTKDKLLEMLADYEPTEAFTNANFKLRDFHHTLKPHILVHIRGFVEYYDALRVNDPVGLAVDVFKNTKNDGVGTDRNCVVYYFLKSFPHGMGPRLARLFEIKDKKTFTKYIDDFTERLSSFAEKSRSAETLSETLSTLYANKKGKALLESTPPDTKKIRFHNNPKLHELTDTEPRVVTKILKHEKAMDDLNTLNQKSPHKETDTSNMGCFDIAMGKPCKHPPGKCPYSHKTEHIKLAQQFIIDQAKKKIEHVEQCKRKPSIHSLQDESDSDAYDTAVDETITTKKTVSAVGPNYFSDSDYEFDDECFP